MRLVCLQPGINGENFIRLMSMNAYMLLYIFHIQLGFWNNNFKKWKPYKTIVEHLRCEGFTIRYNNSYALNSILE